MSVCLSSGSDGRSGLVLPPDPQRAGGPAGAARGRAGGAEGRVRASETVAGQAGGGAEEAEASGPRPGGLHRHSAGANHGAEANTATSAPQVQMKTKKKNQQMIDLLVHVFTRKPPQQLSV